MVKASLNTCIGTDGGGYWTIGEQHHIAGDIIILFCDILMLDG